LVLALIPIFRLFAPEGTFTPEMVNMIIAGFILVAVMPCGLASNVMVMLANANVALAVTIGATTTLLAPFVVPLLMQLFAGSIVELHTWGMMFNIFKMVAFPIIAGFIFNLFNKNIENMKTKVIQMASFFLVIVLASLLGFLAFNSFCYFKETAIFLGIFFALPAVAGYLLNLKFEGDQTLVKKSLGKLSQIGIFTIVLVITAAGQSALAAAGILLVTLVILHNVLGYGAGYCLAWVFGMSEIDRRTMAFEVGMPNAGAASGLAFAIGPIATAGLAPAIYGPVMNIFGSTLASIWKGRPIKEEPKAEEEK
jgi:BASS family bile acid:Na+ symporter